MAVIRPFSGLRYSEEAGSLDALTAPPYDVLSPAQRNEFAAQSDHNVVYLTLPEQEADDRSKYVKYARSAARLAEWRRAGVLVPESKPAFYKYTQQFNVHELDQHFTRTALIALIKVEPYSAGVVLPHEQTFPKHKEDRLRILEATRAHLECIYGLYEDPDGTVHHAVVEAATGHGVETNSQDGVHHVLEPITDEATVQRLTQLIADKKVWIADGHHRYETAVTFREMQGDRDSLIPEDFMMMALSSLSDPGLVLLPTHRVLSSLPDSRSATLEKLATLFHLEEHHPTRLAGLLKEHAASGKRALAVAFEGGVGYLMTPIDETHVLGMIPGNHSDALKKLDVSILHSVILEGLLGVNELEGITYTRDMQEAIRLTNEGAAASFLMAPPTVDDMKAIALGGEKMPQKSTYYYPKIQSGLVIWSLNDF